MRSVCFKDALSPNGFLGIGAKESLRFSRHSAAFTEFVRSAEFIDGGAT